MYRTIDTAIWSDPKFKVLPAPAKLFFVYLITNPHAHVSGIYYLADVIVTHESGLKPETLDTLWDTLSSAGLIRRDKENEVVWVRNMFKHQGRGIKNVTSASHHLNSLHSSELCAEFAKAYPQVLKIKNGYRINRVSGAGLSDQEQDQEQDNKGAAPLVDSIDEWDEGGEVISAETVYRAYPKHVEPEPSRKSITAAVTYLRKRRTPTPWTWLLGRVRLYADSRAELERKYPGAKRFVPACHRWMKKRRYDEDPAIWAEEVPGFARVNGEETPEEFGRRLAAKNGAYA